MDGQCSVMPSNSRVRIEMSVHLRPTIARDQSGRMMMLLAPKAENSLSTLSFRPVNAAMTVVTDATPITMPIVVRIARTLFAQIWPSARKALCQVRLNSESGRRRTYRRDSSAGFAGDADQGRNLFPICVVCEIRG